MYSVILAQKARKFYAKAEVSLAKKIARCFQILEQDPRKHPNIKPLTGKLQGRYRYRIGDYRIIYRIDDQKAQVIVVAISKRSAFSGAPIGAKCMNKGLVTVSLLLCFVTPSLWVSFKPPVLAQTTETQKAEADQQAVMATLK